MISVRILQRSEGDVSDPIKYIYSWSASLDESSHVRLSDSLSGSTQTSLSVLKLSVWNFPKGLISFAGSIYFDPAGSDNYIL